MLTRRQFASGALAGAAALGLPRPAGAQVDDGTWSTNPKWLTLKKTRLITDDRGRVHATIAPEVSALAGKPFVISGFILAIEASASFNHFILSRYSPECPFCAAGAPNEVIEVFAARSFSAASYMVYLRGIFGVQNDVERGLFYRLTNANSA